MTSTPSPSFHRSNSPVTHDDVRHLVSTAFSVIDQTPPPSLREILTAYRTKGDGDRDMLIAMLNAKTAEDQRIASVASLQRTLLDVYQIPRQQSSYHVTQPLSHIDNSHYYPSPSFTQSTHNCDKQSRRQYHSHHRRSHSPPRLHHSSQSARDEPIYQELPPRKRHRASLSPPPREVRPASQHEHLPPSPYSSSGRSNSAEYSPRSRASMAIGSLLSSGPHPDAHAEDL